MVIEQILKEWSSALRFFEHKKVVLIFRKGGIHEKEFEEASSYFGIFKTFEHESKETIKNEYKNYLQNTTAEYTGDFDLEYIAKIKHSFQIDSIDKLEPLDPYHHWEQSYLIERFNFRPKKPLVCYLLELQKIKFPKKVSYSIEEAKGCLSWFKLNQPVEINNTVLINDSFQENKVLKIINNI